MPSNASEKACEELRAAWQNGQLRLIEDVLSAEQRASLSEPRLLELIYGEYLARRALAEDPQEQEYAQRFPANGEAIARLLALHRALGDSLMVQTVASHLYPPGDAVTTASDQPTIDFA